MPRKKNIVKPPQKLKASVTEILMTDNGTLKPYIQTFRYEPENIALQSLGSFCGIFEIEDHSQDSEYIVNFLASVAKKEYFSHPKRPAMESLETTLHKINVSLSELIKQNNTAWLGKLNAALCVIENGNIHFSVSGKAKVLLFRKSILSDISEDLATESDLHPLKTFTEVSSGRLIVDDKILLTTPGIFDICSPEEIQKNACRLSQEKFAQFLNTAMVNQLRFGSTLLLDISEATLANPLIQQQSIPEETPIEDIPNAFSRSAFSHSASKPSTENIQSTQSEGDVLVLENEYTDSKTGHIYVQGDTPEETSHETWLHIQWFFEELWTSFSATSQKIYKNIAYSFQKKQSLTKNTNASLVAEEESAFNTTAQNTDSYDSQTNSLLTTLPRQVSLQITLRQYCSYCIITVKKVSSSLLSILPRISTIKATYSRLNKRQKQYALLALVFIFLAPIIILNAQKDTMQSQSNTPENIPEQPVLKPLSNDKNIRFEVYPQSLFSNTSITQIVSLKDTVFALTDTTLTTIDTSQKTESFALPNAFGTSIRKTTVLHDLQMLLLLTDTGKLISFTPSNKVFTENKIALPKTSAIGGMATYLTYLYVFDTENNTIYRYPRVEGGFGERTTWLKENFPSSNEFIDIAINENVYLTTASKIFTFNKGQQSTLSFEASSTPLVFRKVFAQKNSDFVFALDTVNGRIIRFQANSGLILDQYAHEMIKETHSFTIDEASNKVYLATSSGVFVFLLP